MLDMIDLTGGPTPALYEVLQWASPPLIKRKEFQIDFLIPILGNELHICTAVFDAFAFTQTKHPGHKKTGYSIFKTIAVSMKIEFNRTIYRG